MSEPSDPPITPMKNESSAIPSLRRAALRSCTRSMFRMSRRTGAPVMTARRSSLDGNATAVACAKREVNLLERPGVRS